MRNNEAHDLCHSLKPGDVIQYRDVMRRPATDKVESCKITSIELGANGAWNITYVPCDRDDSVRCGFGCHFIAREESVGRRGETGRSVWGWQWIKKVGHESTPACCSQVNLYKNPGYDLVNM